MVPRIANTPRARGTCTPTRETSRLETGFPHGRNPDPASVPTAVRHDALSERSDVPAHNDYSGKGKPGPHASPKMRWSATPPIPAWAGVDQAPQLEAPCHAGLPEAGARGLPRDLLLPGDLDLVFSVAESLLDDPAVDAFFAPIGSLEYLSGFVCLLPGLIDVDLLGA